MDKYTKHRFFIALVLRDTSTTFFDPSDAIFQSKFSPFSETHAQNPQNLTSEVYFLCAIQHIKELLSKTIRIVTQPRTRLKFSYFN